jgi:hypothetical protein
VSIGWLEEFKVDSLSFVVIDSGKFTSSAVYLPGSDDIVYYTYGSYSDSNKSPTDAGYYLYERNTGKRIFLLHHISDLGPGEMVNGFDISPDGKKLLIPSVRFERKPILMEYDLTTHTIDTLLVDFDVSFDRFALWVRYNHDGSKILYSNYPLFSFSQSSAANDSSEIGIIDRNTLVKQVLKTNPLNTIPWVSVFPQWSLDEARIIYGCAPLLEDGRAGIYQVCILKSLE